MADLEKAMASDDAVQRAIEELSNQHGELCVAKQIIVQTFQDWLMTMLGK